jgi:hypothetical protein
MPIEDQNSVILKRRITTQPLVVEFQHQDQKTDGIDASPKRIADLKPGDEILAKVRIEAIEELPDVPSLENWQSKMPAPNPTSAPAAPSAGYSSCDPPPL